MAETTTSRFSKNVWSLTISQIIFRVATIVVYGYLGQYLGASVLGQYAIVMNVLNLYLAFSDLGVSNFVIKEVSQQRSLGELYLNNFFVLQFILGILIVGLSLLTGEIAGYSTIIMWGLGIGSIGLIFNGLASSYKALLSAQEHLYPFAIIEIGCVIVYVIGNLIVILTGSGLLALIAVTVAVQFTKYVVGAIWARKFHAHVHFKADFKAIRTMLRMGLPFLLFNSAYFAIQRVDVLLIGAMDTEAMSGIYAASSRLIYSSLFVLSVIGTALYPVLSRLYTENRDRVKDLYTRSSSYVYIIGSFIALLYFLAAPYILHIIYGDKFQESIQIFRILTWYIPVFALRLIPGNLLMVGDRVWSAARVSIAGVALTVVLIVVLYPTYGINGVAAIVVGVESLLTIVYFIMVWKSFRIGFMQLKAVPVTAILLASIGLYVLIPSAWLPLQLVAPPVLFVSLIFAARILGRDDIKTIMNILLKKSAQVH